jgi:hypothetical protein
MIEKPKDLLEDFLRAIGRPISPGAISHELLPAPHRPPKLPAGKCAVYVFSLTRGYGQKCPAGQNRVLKVGRVGPKSGPRFQYQHYSPQSARSNLAFSIVNLPVLWSYLGIEALTDDNVRDWLLRNTDRDHFFVDAGEAWLVADLEVYVKGVLGPVFEGSLGR